MIYSQILIILTLICLFGAVKLTKNSEIDEYQYSGYRTGFDSKETFLHPTGSFGQNVIIFGVNIAVLHILPIGQEIF